MSTKANSISPSLLAPLKNRANSSIDFVAQTTVLKLLENLVHGHLTLRLPDGQTRHYGDLGENPVTITVENAALFRSVLQSGDIGLAEGYMSAQWHANDLSAVMALLMRNRGTLERLVYGNFIGIIGHRIRHLFRKNSKTGSKKNIQAHYDLGNEFYKLWLDPTLSYSSALFVGDSNDLQQAQIHKIERALNQSKVGSNSSMLEIGCGWGALAQRAALRGAKVTAITLSREQLDKATAVNRKSNSSSKVDFRLQDYRDLGHGSDFMPFDSIVSIEMLEAVGKEYWADYFRTLKRCLADNGSICIQTITIRDDLFARYQNSTDFIQQYVFPGGMLPCHQQILAHAELAGLVVTDRLSFGHDYARTLAYWKSNYLSALDAVRAQSYSETFIRLWEFYLSYCEAAFITGNCDVSQYTLAHA